LTSAIFADRVAYGDDSIQETYDQIKNNTISTQLIAQTAKKPQTKKLGDDQDDSEEEKALVRGKQTGNIVPFFPTDWSKSSNEIFNQNKLIKEYQKGNDIKAI
jgi:hypothetical protein